MSGRGHPVLSIRIPQIMLDEIQKDIDTSGDFRNKPDYVMAALRHFKKYRELSKKELENSMPIMGETEKEQTS